MSGKRDLKWVFRTFLLISVVGTLLLATVAGVIMWKFSQDLPELIRLEDYKPATVTQVISEKNGEVLGEFFTERRYLLPYDKIPEVAIQAFTAAEDDRFFEHVGINVAAIARAWVANFRAGHVVQGGSTITQQVAKSLLLSREKSYVRKIKEIILASRMEKNLGKHQILYLYLNQIYLGQGAYGLQAASRTYFHKDADKLNVAEAALLAGMPQAPGKYSPLLNSKRVKERQLYVLRRMMEVKFISQAQMAEAARQPLLLYSKDESESKATSYYVEHIRRYLAEKYGDKALYEQGLKAYVPTDSALIALGERAVREGLWEISKRQGWRGPIKRVKPDEVEKFLSDERDHLFESTGVGFVLLEDGKIDTASAVKLAGYTSENDLLKEGTTHRALVLGLDDKKKTYRVAIGPIQAELPTEETTWANAKLTRGDVITVLVKRDPKKPESFSLRLEQEPQLQGALLSIDLQTGYVIAMQGGYDFARSEFNRATQAQRQPGSAFKPIIFAAAVEKGYTPASIIVDSPIVYGEGEEKWKPTNFDERFHGDTTFRQALIKSRNIPTVKIVQQLQIPFVIEFARRVGLNAQYPQDLSLSLGSGATTLLDVTRAYGVFPRLGKKLEPLFFTRILDREGAVLEETKPVIWSPPRSSGTMGADGKPVLSGYPPAEDPTQVLDPRVAYVMTHLMTEVVSYGTGYEAKALGRPAAGKTGTTNDAVDAWFVGFTPQIVTGVWIGHDNQKPIGNNETGAKAALPMWLTFMQGAVKDLPAQDFVMPAGVTFANIDSATGKLAPPQSSRAIREAFVEGTVPTETNTSGTVGNPSPADVGDFFKEDTE